MSKLPHPSMTASGQRKRHMFARSVRHAFEFFAWASRRHRTPTRQDIQDRWPEMSRATAYRWLRAWKDVQGME